MSLQTRLGDLITALGTDYKQIRTWISGSSSGDLTGLNTTNKSSLVAAINEVHGASGTPSDASETVKGILELATQAETNAGTDDARAVTPLKLATRLAAGYQPLDSDLTAIAGLATTSYGRAFLELADQAALVALLPSYQPLDSDLTSISSLTTTSYGRAFLELADQSALMALVQAASATVQGKVELATDAETITGTDTARATTPANLAALFTDRIDTNTALGTSNTKVPSQNAVKTYVDALADAVNVMQFKGNIDASANPNYPAASAGHTYRISVAGKIGGASGPNVEVGDLIICLTDSTSAGTHGSVGSNWSIQQTNIDGAVTGPASATSGNLPTFNGTSGKIVQDSGVSIDNDGAMVANSSTRVPTQAATRSYISTTNYTKSELGDPETDLAALYVAAKA